jgi:hypothetical protein
VSCKAEEREHGVMTALMDAAIDSEVKKGAVMSYLWGNMPRYRHFGFEPAGGRIEFDSIPVRRISRNVDMSGFEAHKPEPSDVEAMTALYERFEARVLRTEQHWLDAFKRDNFECLFTQGQDGSAYLFAKANNKTIVEIQGDVAAVHKLLVYYAQKHEFQDLIVLYPNIQHGHDPVFNFLKESTNWYTVHPTALAAVFGEGKGMEKLKSIYGTCENGSALWISEIDEV